MLFPDARRVMINADGEFIGQLCHIEAAEVGGERFNPNTSNEDRKQFENLMLMCYEHHVITNDVETYSVEMLKDMKAAHEENFTDVAECIENGSSNDAALRRWEYIQHHQLQTLEVFFLLKDAVGPSWFEEVLDETQIHFQKDVQPLTLGTLVTSSPQSPGTEDSGDWTKPPFSFWRLYEREKGYWYRKISPLPRA